MIPLRRWCATWWWLAVAVACGGGTPRDHASARTDDSLAARAMAANAREQSGATSRDAAAPRAEGPRAEQPRAEQPRAGPARGFGPAVGFRSRQRLDEHYAKHGAEFGAISKAEYLRQAQALRDAPVGGDILEIRRGDGSYSRFDRSDGAFLAFDEGGTILTYFRPNDGERYFRRQARRRAGG